MAKVKYATGLIPLLNKHFGAIFQPNYTNQTMKSDSSGARSRLQNQTQKQQGLMKAIRMWRNMTTTVKNNWNTFAATYPQASRRNPAIFLTGYQLFLKRNHYCFLNHGIDCNFMEEPTLEELPEPNFSFSIEDSDNVIDVTELYISNFGIIPQIGQYVLIRIFPMSENSGIFFTPIKQVIEVTESYIDGLFVSLAFTSDVQDITFSVYLSKVVHQSTNYVGTKVRYMGCFTPKTFKALTDTPDSYAGQSGKIPAVKETEDGLEFIDGGGGGISCEDLLDCPIIEQILNNLATLNDFVITETGESFPVIKYGLLYNSYAMFNAKGFTSSVDWTIISWATALAVIGHLGGTGLAGGPLKLDNLTFWDSPNTGATNSTQINGKGVGYRLNNGVFSLLNETNRIRTSRDTGAGKHYLKVLHHNTDNWDTAFAFYAEGLNTFIVRNATGIVDGTTGSYAGNDGRIYRTVVVNEFEFVADPIAETLYRDSSPIPNITDNAEWAADLAGAMCAYNNDLSNV